MKKIVAFLLFVALMYCGANLPVFAENEWVLMEDTPMVMYFLDKQSVAVSEAEQGKSVDFWIKIMEKNNPGFYSLAHFQVKADMTFIKQEHTMYSNVGLKLGSVGSSNKWGTLPSESPVGRITRKLLNEPHANTETNVITDFPGIVVDQKEVKNALDEEKIKQDKIGFGVKNFYVRDRRGPALFDFSTDYITADFCLAIDSNNTRTALLKFTSEDKRPGTHKENGEITLQVDGKDWPLPKTPVNGYISGNRTVNYTYTVNLPNSLIQALVATKSPVTIKWMHWHDGDWKERAREIPKDTLQAIQLMYLGCK